MGNRVKSTGNRMMVGTVTSRKCPFCGHTDIGYETPDGEFHALIPGTLIHVSEMPETVSPAEETIPGLDDIMAEEGGEGEYMPWLPEPLHGDRRLWLKYGVMVKENLLQGPMTGDTYRAAFLRKIEKLVEREIQTPLPVILDRIFSTPQLASGNPRQISQAMWRELDEIQRPVRLMGEWLEKQDEESLVKLIYPGSLEGLGDPPFSREEIKSELEALSLEEFLEML